MYIGCCGSETHTQWLADIKNITGYEQTGCTLSMFANRLSFFFDFKGPSKSVDTGVQLACQRLSLSSHELTVHLHLHLSLLP